MTAGVVSACISSTPCGRVIGSLRQEIGRKHGYLRAIVKHLREKLDHGDLENAEATARLMVENASHLYNLNQQDIEPVVYSRHCYAVVLAAQGRLDEALQLYQSVLRASIQTRGMAEYAQLALRGIGQIAYAHHDDYALGRALKQHDGIATTGCTCRGTWRHKFLGALLDMERKEFSRAVRRLSDLTTPFVSTYEQLTAQFALAECYALQGQVDTACEALMPLHTAIMEWRLEGAFINHAHLFPMAASIARQFHLCRASDLLPYSPESPRTGVLSHQHLQHIQVRLFGPVQVAQGDQEIEVHGDMPRILLAYLATHEDGADMEGIVKDIFPESAASMDAEQAMRELIRGLNGLATYNDGIYCFTQAWHSDALRYDKLYANVQLLDVDRRFDSLKQLATLQRAPFLQGVRSHLWTEERRSVYAQRQSWVYYQIGALQDKHGNPHAAIEALDQALKHNPYFDSAVEQLMRIRFAMGNHAMAMRTYQLYAQRIQRVFDTVPSGYLQHLMERISLDGTSNRTSVTGEFSAAALRRAGITNPNLLASGSD